MILPRIKNYQTQEGAFFSHLIFEKSCEIALLASEFMAIFKPNSSFSFDKSANVAFYKEDFDKIGTYKIKVAPSFITITYGDLEGVRNAMATLCQLQNNDEIPCCDIYDVPDNHFRSCMLDLARGYVEISVLKEYIVRMAYLKYNHIHLHLMDRQSYAIQSDVVPNVDNHKLYTKQEMKELCEFCKTLSLEVIPEIEIPAHGVNQIRAIPELACEIIDKKKAVDIIRKVENPRKREFIDNELGVSSWVVCAGKQSTYEIYEKIIKEICEVFDGKYLHVGGDEIEFPHLGAHPHWENCVHCKKLMEQENIKDIRALYYYVMKRMHKIVSSYGKKMIMWNDQLDVLNPIDIPKDIIVEYWNGEVITEEKQILQKLCDQGFKVINAHYLYTYADLPVYMQERNIGKWNTKIDMLSDGEVNGDIFGGEMCAWELGNPLYDFYPYSLPVCLTLFADRVWNNDTTEYTKEYKKSIFSVILGKKMELHPFEFFNEIIPPRDCKRSVLEGIDFDRVDGELLEKVLTNLKQIDEKEIYGKIALSSYEELLERIKWCLS